MNLFTPLKKFIKLNREEKTMRLLCIGFIGFIAALILDLCKILPETTAAELTIGVFIVLFGAGCLMMCTIFIKHEEKAARFACCGAFGICGLMCTECVVDYLVEHLISVTLPQITAWYAWPCLILYFTGILMIAGQAVKEAWRRA